MTSPSSYRDNPIWQRARSVFIEPSSVQSPTESGVQRIQAVNLMALIERGQVPDSHLVDQLGSEPEPTPAPTPPQIIEGLQAKRDELLGRRETLRQMFAEDVITDRQAQRGEETFSRLLADVDARIEAAR